MSDKTTTPEPLKYGAIQCSEIAKERYAGEERRSQMQMQYVQGLEDGYGHALFEHSAPQRTRIKELEDQVKALRDAQSKPIQGEVDGWISVDDRLPEYGNPVLIVVLDITSMGYREKITGGGHMWFYIDGDPISYSEEPTHWQPLPPPPVRASPQ